MKKLLIFLASRLVKPVIRRYTSRPTHYRYAGMRILVLPGIFHPQFFFSTRVMLGYLKTIDLKNKSFLELGSGSGLVSLFAARRGAFVTACDISHAAVENTLLNQRQNELSFPVIQSDLFNKIPVQQFDVVVINPPYYKKDPVLDADHAWYCGEHSQYFQKLFSTLQAFIHGQSQVIMVLSDVCDITLIKAIALKNRLELRPVSERRLLLETNFIFQVVSLAA